MYTRHNPIKIFKEQVTTTFVYIARCSIPVSEFGYKVSLSTTVIPDFRCYIIGLVAENLRVET